MPGTTAASRAGGFTITNKELGMMSNKTQVWLSSFWLFGLHSSFLILVIGCGSNATVQPAVPYGVVNISINLTNQQYTALRFDNGAITLPPNSSAGPAGVKGLIVVRENAGTYRAFERNCPYQPYAACALVSVDRSRLFLRDTCCGSQFDLQGQVTGGPAPRPLVQYSTSLQGNLLYINN